MLAITCFPLENMDINRTSLGQDFVYSNITFMDSEKVFFQWRKSVEKISLFYLLNCFPLDKWLQLSLWQIWHLMRKKWSLRKRPKNRTERFNQDLLTKKARKRQKLTFFVLKLKEGKKYFSKLKMMPGCAIWWKK